MKNLKPTNIDVMCAALELRAESFDPTSLGVAISENLNNPFASEQAYAKNLMERLDQFLAAPESGLFLSSEDERFLIDALHHLIQIDHECMLSEKKRKRLKYYENEMRAASVCISLLQESPASDGV